jgi:hypothetical protein
MQEKSEMSEPKPFVSLVKQTFDQLITGLNYGAYRNQRAARMDDQLIRSRADQYLKQALEVLSEKRKHWQKQNIPRSMSRENPLPSREILDRNAEIDNVLKEMESLRSWLVTLPVPESSDFWDRYVSQEQRVAKIREQDELLLSTCYEVNRIASNVDIEVSFESNNNVDLRQLLERVRDVLKQRSILLNS